MREPLHCEGCGSTERLAPSPDGWMLCGPCINQPESLIPWLYSFTGSCIMIENGMFDLASQSIDAAVAFDDLFQVLPREESLA